MPRYQPTEMAIKMQELSKKIPAPLSWLIPDPYNPSSYVAPIGMPFYRVEVPAKNWLGEALGKWGGPFRYHTTNKEIQKAISDLGQYAQTPGTEFKALSNEAQRKLRFLFRDKARQHLSEIKELSKKYPSEVRVLEFPNEIEKHAKYSDLSQIAVELDKMLEYLSKSME